MREKTAARASNEYLATPQVAPRFTRAAEAERSRLQARREQLVRKREAFEEEIGHIDRAIGAVDDLLGKLAPLLAANGSEPGAAGDGSTPGAEARAAGSHGGETHRRDRAEH